MDKFITLPNHYEYIPEDRRKIIFKDTSKDDVLSFDHGTTIINTDNVYFIDVRCKKYDNTKDMIFVSVLLDKPEVSCVNSILIINKNTIENKNVKFFYDIYANNVARKDING